MRDKNNLRKFYANVITTFSSIGQIHLPDEVKNNDFEDIAVSSEATGDYIYVGDIGNDWPKHCPGWDQTYRMVHIFREPNLAFYK